MKKIEQLVDETLSSLDDVQRVEANPFLYTKIEQRLKNGQVTSSIYQRKLMPVLAVALALFITLNMVSYFRLSTNDVAPASAKAASGIENFANEYNLSEETGL